MKIEHITLDGRRDVVSIRLRFDHNHRSNAHTFTIDKFDMDRSIKAGKKGVKLKLKSGEVKDYSFTCTTPEEYIAGWTRFCIADANELRVNSDEAPDFVAEDCEGTEHIPACAKECFKKEYKELGVINNRGSKSRE